MESRRVCGVLVVDLVGSTERLAALGDAVGARDQAAYLGTYRAVVDAHGGQVVKALGDGVLAEFASVSSALEAAVALQQATGRILPVEERPAQARVGLAAGEVAVTDGDLAGLAVVEATRLCSAAAPAQILVSDLALTLAGGHPTTRPVGALDLKGLPRPVPATEILWEPATEELGLPPGLIDDGLPFSGRHDVLRRLDEHWQSATGGRSGLVLVAGEPGIGKTRLVGEFAARVHADGALVALGRCDELSGLGLAPFVEMLRRLLKVRPDLAGHRGLAQLLPELGAAPDDREPAAEQVDLYDAVVDAVADAAGSSPVLLVLDDLHWATDATLGLLSHLLDNLDEDRVLVVVTYRDTDVDRRHPLGAFIASRRATVRDRIGLDGLGIDDVEGLLTAASGQDLERAGRDLATALCHTTGGNAFFVGALLAHLVDTGALAQQDGQWALRSDLGRLGLPEGIRDVLGRRLSLLSDEVNHVLRVAAVIGRTFDVGLLARITGRTPDQVLGSLEAAAARRLVAEEAGVIDRFAFAHALIRQVLLEEIGATRRARWHQEVGEALAATAADGTDDMAAAALHLLEAAPLGAVDRAVQVACRASTASPASTLFAQTFVAELLHHVDRQEVTPTADLAGLLADAAQGAFMLGERDRTGDYADWSVAVARTTGDDERFALAVASGLQASGFGLDLRFLALVPEALERIGPDTSVALSLMAQRDLASALFADGSDPVARAEELDRRARWSLANLEMDLDLMLAVPFALAVSGWSLLSEPDTDRAVAPLLESLAVVGLPAADRALGGSAPLKIGLMPLMFLRIRRAELDQVLVDADEFEENAGHLPALVAACYQQRSNVAMLRGDLDRSTRLTERVGVLVPDEPMYASGRALQELWRSHLAGDDAAAVRVVEALDADGLFPYPRAAAALAGVLALGDGDEVRAAACWDRAWADGVNTIGHDWCRLGTIQALAELAAGLGHREAAPELEAALAPCSGQLVLFCCTHVPASVDWTRAQLARLAGDHERERGLLQDALALEAACGAVTLAARTRSELAALT